MNGRITVIGARWQRSATRYGLGSGNGDCFGILVYKKLIIIKFMLLNTSRWDSVFMVNLCDLGVAYTTRSEGVIMNKLTFAAAVVAISAMLVPAQAENLMGAPTKNGNQCFKFAPSFERDARWGSWGACPQAASTAAAPTAQRRVARRPASR